MILRVRVFVNIGYSVVNIVHVSDLLRLLTVVVREVTKAGCVTHVGAIF